MTMVPPLTTRPAGPLRGALSVPGDKSITHRAIILSALADGEVVISNYCPGEDCLRTARAMQALGIPIEIADDQMRVTGKGLWGLREPQQILDCGNSGTGIRLLAGVLAGQDFFSVLTGDDSIRKRPMGRVVGPLREMGAVIAGRRGGELAPLAITGARLRGIAYRSPIASAQVKSALLLAGLFAEGITSVTEPALSRDHTERMFGYLGLPLTRDGLTARLVGRPSFPAQNIAVAGDLSAAAFFLVAASLVPDSDVTIAGVGVNPTRAGILEALQDMGARIEVLNPRDQAGEPVADLRVRAAPLHGITIGPDRIPRTIDELPVLCVAAAGATGETVIFGASELRVKESDRIATMATEMRRLGVEVEERADGLRILGGRPLKGAVCRSYGDHRVAMSLAIAGLVARGETRVEDTACVATSFPGFDKNLRGLLTPPSQG
jgi:3-phosphoshikimate 1-carboxyvinyltransferase